MAANNQYTTSYILLIIIVVFSFPLNGKAGNGDTKNHTIILPRKYQPLELKSSLALMFTRLPLDWVETSIDVPIFQFAGKLGLPAGFTLETNLQSIIVSNQLRLGPRWNFQAGRFSMSGGMDAAMLFGKMEIAGFDNKAWGWSFFPCVSAGIKVKDIAFTVSAEYNILQSLKISSGDIEISKSKNFKSGQTIALFMEQKLWKEHIMIIGLINNFQKFYYLAWPAFSTFNRRYYIPQIYIGLVL